jgi:hypothetical protein
MRSAFEELQAPFPESEVRWRVGARSSDKQQRGLALPYLAAHRIQARLDEVVGPQNWKSSFESLPEGVRCQLALRCGNDWVGKEGVASYEQTSPSVGANKTVGAGGTRLECAYDAAFTRAAAAWGVGRYLQDFEAPWVDLCDETGFAQIPQLPAHLLPQPEALSGEVLRASTQPVEAASTAPARQTQPQSTPASSGSSARSESVAAPPSTADASESSSTSTVPIGTAEQWAALNETQRNTAGVLLERLRSGAALHSLEDYLTKGNGKTLPGWLRTELRRKLAERSAAGAAGTAISEAAVA